MRPFLLLATLVAGCSSRTFYTDEGLWDPEVVSTTAGTYVNQPHAGQLLRVQDNGNYSVIDLDGATPTRMVATPDSEKLLVFSRWQECKDDDDKIVYVSDCPYDELVSHNELSVVEGDAVTLIGEIAPHMNALAFSDDGDIAVAYLDYENGDDIEIDGIADLGEVRFMRLSDGSEGRVSVGFSPERILFSQDGEMAVIMSRSVVVAVDLETFERVLEAPLRLDADDQVDPSGAALTPDGGTLLVTVVGSSDLYMLELGDSGAYWNLASLGAEPATLAVDEVTNRSVFVFAGSPEVDVLDNDGLDAFSQGLIESISLDEPATDILMGEGTAVLFNPRRETAHDVYQLNLESLDLIEYVMDNPVDSMQLTGSGRYAVGVLKPETSYTDDLDGFQDALWGLGVIDLAGEEAVSLVTASRPVGVALVEDETSSYALVLLEGLEYLLYVDLSNPSAATQVDLPAPPAALSTLPDGRFLISHTANLGLLSFLDPQTLEMSTVEGFAAAGLLNEDTLPRRGDEGGE